jgi:MFS family permease
VFCLGAVLAVPGLWALRRVGAGNGARPADTASRPSPARGIVAALRDGLGLLRDRRLRWFALCCALFHLSNAFMLPLAAGAATASLGARATLVIGACIVGPQIVVALLSPAVGRAAERWGRRPVLAAGMLALPLRGLALAAVVGSTVLPAWLLIPVQLLDGVSGAAFGVMMPLVAADLTRGSGRFNLCMGLLGLAVGGAATVSSLLGGRLADHSMTLAFLVLALAGAGGTLAAWLMPETRAPGEGGDAR